ACIDDAEHVLRVFGPSHSEHFWFRPARSSGSHTGFACIVTAEAVSPVGSLGVLVFAPIGAGVFFLVLFARDLSGTRRRLAVTSDRSRLVGAQFSVGGSSVFGCLGLVEAQFYEPIRVLLRSLGLRLERT